MSIRQNSGKRGRPRNPILDDGIDDIVGSPDAGSIDSESIDIDGSGEDESLDPVSKMPDEISDMIQGLGISGDFRVSVFKIPEGKRRSELQATYQSRCPPVEEFASEFGGGDYIIVITWHQVVSGKTEKMQRKIQISVGKHFDLIAKKKENDKRRDFQMENFYPQMQEQKQVENPLDTLIKYKSLLPQQSSGLEILGPIVAIMQQNSQNMMQMMQANMQMLVTVMGNKRSTTEELKELLEIKEMMGGDSKERSITQTLVEEGMGFLRDLAPGMKDGIRELIKNLNNPFTRNIAKKKALEDPRIAQVLSDPEQKAQMIEHLYSENPAKEVDTALITMGIITENERRG